MKEGSNHNTRTPRIDKRKRVELRVDIDTHRKVKVRADKHDTSLNHLIFAMIQYCLDSEDFNVYLENRFPRDLRHGFYVYHPGKEDPIWPHGYGG